MDMRSIGSFKVSTIGVGCNNFGSRIDEAQTKAVIDAAIDCGINFFDTADMYGKTLSEEFLGRALGSRRKDVIIATKFGYEIDGQKGGASAAYVKSACEASLKRLGTDVIDLYQLHLPDPETPIAETLGALNELVQAGKVREIGCSNFDVPMLREAASAVPVGAARFVSLQNHYSLFHREPEVEVLDECDQTGVGFLPYFPLASGLLTGKYRKGGPKPDGTRIKEDSERLSDENLDQVERLIAYAESKGRTLLELSVSYLLAHKPVSSVIAGATKPEQIQANATAGDWTLTKTEVEEIRALATVSF